MTEAVRVARAALEKHAASCTACTVPPGALPVWCEARRELIEKYIQALDAGDER